MSLALQLRDYRITTAEILYHLPDHPAVLQTYVWQNLDLAPSFPELRRFLAFWQREIEGRLHSVRLASCATIQPPRLTHRTHELTLHRPTLHRPTLHRPTLH